MKKFFETIIAILFPWLVLFIHNNPGGALVALLLQATVIGWIPASMWAIKVIHEADDSEKPSN